jgi:hypothetical protein
MTDGGPVPGRECGACDVCCVVFEIEVPSIAKPAGEPCRHLTKGGCAIYAARPDVCRHWLCGWRLIAGLPENWRPDLCGILVYQMKCEEPGYGPAALIISLNRGLAHLGDPSVLGFIQNMVERRVPLYLTRNAGRGRSTFLNEILGLSVTTKNSAAFIAILTRLVGTD